jgi:hypothetical protein
MASVNTVVSGLRTALFATKEPLIYYNSYKAVLDYPSGHLRIVQFILLSVLNEYFYDHQTYQQSIFCRLQGQ